MISITAGVLACLFGLGIGGTVSVARRSDASASDGLQDYETNITGDLNAMGVKASDYPAVSGAKPGDLSFLSLVEWGYQPLSAPSAGYCLYAYFYNPSCTIWDSSAYITVAPLRAGVSATDVSRFYSCHMVYCANTSDYSFYKFKIPNAYCSAMFSFLDTDCRRYYLGSLTMTESATRKNYSLPMGKEIDFTGFCKDEANGRATSTLTANVSDAVVIRAEVQPFVSDLGYFDYTSDGNGLFSMFTDYTSRVGLDSHNCLFSLPKTLDKYGSLYSAHYDFYKYRTKWIFTTSNKADYDDIYRYRYKHVLGSDYKYPANGAKDSAGVPLTPSFGYSYVPFFDEDDLPYNSGYGRYAFSRYFNNNVDGPVLDDSCWKLRTDCPAWVFYDKDLVGTSLADNEHNGASDILGGKTMQDYFNSYSGDTSLALPRLNGYCPSDLVYVPSYSKDDRFCKYGAVDETVSKDDLLGSAFSTIKDTMDYSFTWTRYVPGYGSGTYGGNAFEIFKKLYSDKNPDKVPYVFGGSQVPMLSDYSADDFMVSNSFPSYKDDIASFVSGNAGNNVYRLTYDLSHTSSNTCLSGSSSRLMDTWTAANATASKTDVCLDFQFIDFTFKDATGKTYTLPASSDPFSTFGDIHQAYIPYLPPLLDLINDSLSKWLAANPWIWAVLGVLVLICIGILVAIFPAVFGVVKAVFKGFVWILKAVVEIIYFLGFWWWFASIMKATHGHVPPVNVFQFKSGRKNE